MSAESFHEETFLNLLATLLEGDDLSPSDREAFNEALRHHPEARQLYRDHMELHSRLHLDYHGGLAPEAMPGEESSPAASPPSRSEWTRTALPLAATLIATLFVMMLLRDKAPTEVNTPVANGVAVLSRSLGVKWQDQAPRFQEGDTLPPGPIQLASGLAQIEFIDGATVILEGPAELDIESPTKAVFRNGRLRAFVPEPARGFVIEGPSYDAVDLGTEFAMSVDANGESEIHVIDGEVAVHEKGGQELALLTTGKATRLDRDQPDMEAIDLDDSNFVDRQAMLQMSDEGWEIDYANWKESRFAHASDPDTILYFDFEDHAPWDRQIRNRHGTDLNGGIVGARWTTGRWPGKGALEFKRVTDRIRIDIPVTCDSLTLATWVRIGGLDQRHNSLFLTDGWEKGEPHWHIGDQGQLTFGIAQLSTLHTEPLLTPEDLGRWIHLAVTYDHEDASITHFLNGEAVATASTNRHVPVAFGPSEIGNWQPHPGSNAAVRSFNGRVDEFLISRRAYSASDIETLYETGTPYR